MGYKYKKCPKLLKPTPFQRILKDIVITFDRVILKPACDTRKYSYEGELSAVSHLFRLETLDFQDILSRSLGWYLYSGGIVLITRFLRYLVLYVS